MPCAPDPLQTLLRAALLLVGWADSPWFPRIILHLVHEYDLVCVNNIRLPNDQLRSMPSCANYGFRIGWRGRVSTRKRTSTYYLSRPARSITWFSCLLDVVFEKKRHTSDLATKNWFLGQRYRHQSR